MASTVNQPRIARSEYAAFAALLKSDGGFPATHEEWVVRCEAERDKCHKLGKRLNLIDVHPKRFEDYCKAHAQKPSLRMLAAFASEQSRTS